VYVTHLAFWVTTSSFAGRRQPTGGAGQATGTREPSDSGGPHEDAGGDAQLHAQLSTVEYLRGPAGGQIPPSGIP
jgi:hypothetical protein